MKNKNALKFIKLVHQDCLKHDVDLIFHPVDRIKMGKDFYVSGFWSEEEKTLNIATNHDEWLTVLAHEYGHFCQWKENKFIDQETHDAYVNYDSWLFGEIEMTQKEINNACKQIQKCELDCEKRAVKFIKKYHLSDDITDYIQKSNSYVLGYEASKLLRKWFTVAPSRINKLNKLMPKTFTKQFKPTKRQLNIMLESCF